MSDDVTKQAWFIKAAAEARKESERWLAGPGSKYPRHPQPWWPDAPRPKRKPKPAAPQAAPKLRIR